MVPPSRDVTPPRHAVGMTSTAEMVRVAEGVELPADLVAMLDAVDRYVADVTARILVAADRDGDCHDDGHRSLRPWVNAHLNTSRRDANDDVRLAALGAAHPLVLSLLGDGALSVSHARALADTYANPRLHDAFAVSISWLCQLATTSSFDVFAARLHTWAQLADTDGADPDPQEQRRAHVGTVADTTYLDAAVPGVAGAEIAEILERFTQAEFTPTGPTARPFTATPCAPPCSPAPPCNGEPTHSSPSSTGRPAPSRVSRGPRAGGQHRHRPTHLRGAAGRNDRGPARRVRHLRPGPHLECHRVGDTDPASRGRHRRHHRPRAPCRRRLGQHRHRVRPQAPAVHRVVPGRGDRPVPAPDQRPMSVAPLRVPTNPHRPHRPPPPPLPDRPRQRRTALPAPQLVEDAGYQTWRDQHGQWHTVRPDGTPITPA